MPNDRQTVIAISTKNTGLAFALGFLFGPLGMLYSTIPGAIVMFLVNVVVGFVTFGFGLFLTWPLCALWAAMAASSFNRQLLSSGS